MIYVIRGTSNNRDFYAVKGTSSGKTVYHLSSDLKGATKWKSESGARNILKKGLVSEEAQVVSFSEDEYKSLIEQELQVQVFNEFERTRERILDEKGNSSYTDDERQIATALLNLKVGSRIRFYPKRNSLTYTTAEVSEIKPTTFVVHSKEYSRLTGEGERAEYVLPDDAVADRLMSERIIKDFHLRPSAYNLTPEQKMAIAKILRG